MICTEFNQPYLTLPQRDDTYNLASAVSLDLHLWGNSNLDVRAFTIWEAKNKLRFSTPFICFRGT